MTLQTWLASELAATGIHVLEVDGWKTRQTRVGFTPQGVVLHDTVTPPGLTREQEQAILVNGRPDLAGPLAQLGLHRDGYLSVIAAGRCNHNGFGSWGNDSYGIETFCYGAQPGHEEPYNALQRDTAQRAAAVICKHHSWDVGRVKGHKETDPTRKIDPYLVDMMATRIAVGRILNPAPHPAPPQEDELQSKWIVTRQGDGQVGVTDFIHRRDIFDPVVLGNLTAFLTARGYDANAVILADADYNAIPVAT